MRRMVSEPRRGVGRRLLGHALLDGLGLGGPDQSGTRRGRPLSTQPTVIMIGNGWAADGWSTMRRAAKSSNAAANGRQASGDTARPDPSSALRARSSHAPEMSFVHQAVPKFLNGPPSTEMRDSTR